MKKKEMLKTVLKKLEKIEETKQGQLKGGFASFGSNDSTTNFAAVNNCRGGTCKINNCTGGNCVEGCGTKQ